MLAPCLSPHIGSSDRAPSDLEGPLLQLLANEIMA